MIKCPNDQTDLKQSQFKGLKIEECINCQGLWFDRDELRLAKDRTDDDLRWLDFELFDEKSEKYNTSRSKKNVQKIPER